MTSREDIYFSLVLVVIDLTRIVDSRPHEFCLDNFNASDCGKAPTDVVYYFKPGSRCEIRKWRGCPTLNRFPNYFSCQHFCIMRIWGDDAVDLPKGVHKKAQDELTEELEKIDVDNIDLIDQALDEMMEADHTKTKLVFYKNKEAVTESQEIGQPVEVIVT